VFREEHGVDALHDGDLADEARGVPMSSTLEVVADPG
jgi:hypothetical protein